MSQGIYDWWCRGINVRTTVCFIFVDWDFVSYVKESYPNVQPLSSYIYVCVTPELCLHQDLHLLRSSCLFAHQKVSKKRNIPFSSSSPYKTDRQATFVLTLHLVATKSCCSSFMYSSQLFMNRIIQNQLPDTYSLEVQMP
jgi:hypothetical protein